MLSKLRLSSLMTVDAFTVVVSLMPESSYIRIPRQTIPEIKYLAAIGKASGTAMKVRDENTDVPNKICATVPTAISQHSK